MRSTAVFLAVPILLLGLSGQVFGAEVGPDWALVDSTSFQGKIPAGDRLVISFDTAIGSLQLIAPEDNLSDLARQAVERAPDWLKADLADIFSRVDTSYQDPYAQLILDVKDPVVDEVVFQVAHLDPEALAYLADHDFTGLLVENAEGVYQNDVPLDYVEVVDYGSSSDEDYYSTTTYRLQTAQGDTVDFEIPREYYYWYVVHPVILRSMRSTESIRYVDPHTGKSAPPPTGVFWRGYLFEHADPGYPVLKDQLAGCRTVWNSLVNVDSKENGAVGIVSQWVQDVMTWNSGEWRPIQPVSIYHLHMGRCGEHASITGAAARSALIPATSSSASADNHTWNEFWAGRWIQWEPVLTLIDFPQSYDPWWSLSAVINHRGDGYVWTVTERYTPSATLTVEVLDRKGIPVDGAGVSLLAPSESWGIFLCAWQYTDTLGRCTFTLGDRLDYYVTVQGRIGSTFQTQVISQCKAEESYFWSCNLPGQMPQLPLEPAADALDSDGNSKVWIRFKAPYEVVYGKHMWNQNTFAKKLSPGRVDFFACDQENYERYLSGEPFETYEIRRDAASGEVTFTLSTKGVWYAVLSNEEAMVSKQQVEVTAKLYERKSTAVAEADDAFDVPKVFSLSQNYPNPFNPLTTILFQLPKVDQVDLSVYNLLGQKVRTLVDEAREPGRHLVIWDGKDEAGREVASGVYLYRLEAGSFTETRKALLLR